jgi:hypothetical protein
MVYQSDILYGFFWRYLNLSMLFWRKGALPVFPGYGRAGGEEGGEGKSDSFKS